jgi:cytochrome P450
MATAISDELFTPDIVNDPYPYFTRLREADPIYWNETYKVWIVTSYEDVVWLIRLPSNGNGSNRTRRSR